MTAVPYEELLLERMRVQSAARINPEVLTSAVSVDVMADDFTGMLWARLTSEVLSEKLIDREQIVTFDFPASWWQHYKADVFPRSRFGRWLLTHFPVKTAQHTRKVHLEQFATFPATPIRMPEEHRGPLVVALERATWYDQRDPA